MRWSMRSTRFLPSSPRKPGVSRGLGGCELLRGEGGPDGGRDRGRGRTRDGDCADEPPTVPSAMGTRESLWRRSPVTRRLSASRRSPRKVFTAASSDRSSRTSLPGCAAPLATGAATAGAVAAAVLAPVVVALAGAVVGLRAGRRGGSGGDGALLVSGLALWDFPICGAGGRVSEGRSVCRSRSSRSNSSWRTSRLRRWDGDPVVRNSATRVASA